MQPESITSRIDALEKLCAENPIYIPLPVAADFLGCNAEGLRFGIEQGTVPFGFSWQKPKVVERKKGVKTKIDGEGNRAFKIPTLKFYAWCMDGIPLPARR